MDDVYARGDGDEDGAKRMVPDRDCRLMLCRRDLERGNPAGRDWQQWSLIRAEVMKGLSAAAANG